MYAGRTLFVQIMHFITRSTFYRIVARYGGDYRIRTFRCTDQFRIMAFAQLTYRESLRDIDACLCAQAAKLYHMSIGGAISRSNWRDSKLNCVTVHSSLTHAKGDYAHVKRLPEI